MTLFFWLLFGWASGATIALIFNYVIHSTDKDDD